MTTDLNDLLTPSGSPVEARPVPGPNGNYDIALIVDGGYSRTDADDMAAWYAAQLIRHGVRAVAPERGPAGSSFRAGSPGAAPRAADGLHTHRAHAAESRAVSRVVERASDTATDEGGPRYGR